MSFRSRSHTKPIAPPRRRSSSLTRTSGSSNGYQTSSNGRPYSIHGSAQLNYSSQGGSANYLSNYGSNQNLRSGSDYYGNDYRRSSGGYGGSSNGTLKFPITTMSTGAGMSSYTSPYKDRYSQNYYMNGSNPSSSSGYTSAYKDRGYYNPYTSSSYENGVTTASFSIPGPSSVKRDYNPRGSGNLTSTSGLSGSSSNLMSSGQAIANLGRSQSLREHERKSRSRKYKEAAIAAVPDSAVPYDATASSLSAANKSLSSASLHSEGYEVRKFMGGTF